MSTQCGCSWLATIERFAHLHRSILSDRPANVTSPLHPSLTPLQNGLAGIAPRTRGARKRKPVLHRWHYTEIAIHSSLRYPDLFAFLRIVVNARLEMNRLRYSVSLSYEVMDPMADFLLNIEAARTSRQVVVAEQLTFPPVNSDHPLHGCGAVQPPA